MSTSLLQFVTGNPLIKNSTGSIQLFKECSLDCFDAHQLLDPARLIAEKTDLQFNAQKCLVCILSVPSFMIPHDLLHFLAPFLPHIKEVSTLRHYAGREQCLVLLELTSPEVAARFIREYHGAPLCSLQPTTCLVYRSATVTVTVTTETETESVADNCLSAVIPCCNAVEKLQL